VDVGAPPPVRHIRPRRPRARLIVRQRLVGEALRSLLQETGEVDLGPVEMLDPALVPGTGFEADVIVLDLAGFDAAERALVERLGAPGERPPIVVLVDEVNPLIAHRAVECGVEGVLDRAASAGTLVLAIKQVLHGQSVFPSRALVLGVGAPPQGGLATLSERQCEVLRLMAEGRSNEEIGRELYISVNTVKFHVREIFRRLGLHNRVQAAQRYTELRGSAGA